MRKLHEYKIVKIPETQHQREELLNKHARNYWNLVAVDGEYYVFCYVVTE